MQDEQKNLLEWNLTNLKVKILYPTYRENYLDTKKLIKAKVSIFEIFRKFKNKTQLFF